MDRLHDMLGFTELSACTEIAKPNIFILVLNAVGRGDGCGVISTVPNSPKQKIKTHVVQLTDLMTVLEQS